MNKTILKNQHHNQALVTESYFKKFNSLEKFFFLLWVKRLLVTLMKLHSKPSKLLTCEE